MLFEDILSACSYDGLYKQYVRLYNYAINALNESLLIMSPGKARYIDSVRWRCVLSCII